MRTNTGMDFFYNIPIHELNEIVKATAKVLNHG